MTELDIPEEGKEGIIKSKNVPKVNPPARLKVGSIGILTGAILVLFVLLSFALVIANQVQKSRTSSKIEDIKEIDTELGNMEQINEKAEQIHAQVNELTNLLAKKAFWTQFFKEFSKRSTTKINIANLEVGEDDSIEISGFARDYEALAKFMVSMEESEYFLSSVLNEATKEEGAILFALELNYSGNILIEESDENNNQLED